MRTKPKEKTSSALRNRVDELLKQMTLDEKIAQLCGVYFNDLNDRGRLDLEKCRRHLANGIGQISRIGGDTDLEPQQIAGIARGIQNFLAHHTRLKIPAMVHEECLSGYMARGATTFPQAIGMASMWEPELVRTIAASIRKLMLAAGVHHGLAPVLDVARDPRWGRIEETFGEDPYLCAVNGLAYVQGLQGNDLSEGIAATGKHFAAYARSESGRQLAPGHVGPRELREEFLFPFEVCIREGKVAAIMNAYHELDGEPCAGSRKLLTDTLRGELGFDGVVVADYGSVGMLHHSHFVTANKKESACLALRAGIDIELPGPECYPSLREAVADGSMDEATIDTAVRRVLAMKARLGLLHEPVRVRGKASVTFFDSPANRRLARQAGRESIVLLKNTGVLPLRGVKRIALIGPNADERMAMLGDYAHLSSRRFWQKSGPDWSALKVVAVLDGIRGAARKGCRVLHSKGANLVDGEEMIGQAAGTVRGADVAVLVLGEDSILLSGENKDDDQLALPAVQQKLLRAVAATGVPIVLVLASGRPLALADTEPSCAAIVQAWYPGEEGGHAIADVLFGRHNPSGKLTVSFPARIGQVPVHYSRRPQSLNAPNMRLSGKALYPFGHGLSYTSFEYSGLTVSPSEIGADGRVQIGVTVENTGAVAGAEVVQFYVRDAVASVTRPIMELKGFHKVRLKPGQRKKVQVTMWAEQMALLDPDFELVVEPGLIDVMVGSSSADIRLRGQIWIVGAARAVSVRRHFLSQSAETAVR